MQIQILKQDENKLRFVLKGINTVIANTLRRLITDEVPSLAVEEVTFIKNSSALYDEVIAHRLGLVPLKTDLKSFSIAGECKCKGEGCSICRVHFQLKASGPAKVYAEEIKFNDKKVKAVYPKMIIVNLLKGQKLDLNGYAILGNGKDHNKFTPGLLFYQGFPMIDVKNCKGKGKCVEVCPKDILKLEGGKVKVQNIEHCHLCKACEDACPENAINVEGSKENIIFNLESFGQITPKDMLLAALEVMDKKLDDLEKGLKKLKI